MELTKELIVLPPDVWKLIIISCNDLDKFALHFVSKFLQIITMDNKENRESGISFVTCLINIDLKINPMGVICVLAAAKKEFAILKWIYYTNIGRNPNCLAFLGENGACDEANDLEILLTVENGVLLLATKKGRLDIVTYLSECGADIHANNDEVFRTSAKHKHLDIVTYLSECGANIHANSNEAFIYSIRNKDPAMVQFFVRKGTKC